MISGVRQSSALGPILFLILICAFNKDVRYSSISSFADYKRVQKQISSIEECDRLQKDLDNIYELSIAINMCFKSCKFKIIGYTSSNGPVINYAYLANDGSEIIEKEHLRGLGVTMSNNATFQDHMSNIARSIVE